MRTLHLGVVVQPYRATGALARTLGIKHYNAKTTYDVAQILEEKYGVMFRYFQVREKKIINALEWSVVGAIGTLIQGGKKIDPFASAMQQIQSGFRDFIASKEAEQVGIPGTPTKAALAGVNHRLKHPYAKSNPRRPSFLDTGLYMSSFRAWMDSK